jgi:Cu-processing system ATP-binding protein
VISVEELTKAFGSVKALDQVSFTVEPAEVVALLGPNGAGKSTALKAIVGLLRPTGGRVSVGGHDPWRKPVQARREVGYLPQRVAFPGTLSPRAVLAFYAGLRGLPTTRVQEAVERTALSPWLDRAIGEFSGGMLQRLGLAVALLGNPRVLILDEPSQSLDPDGQTRLKELIKEWRAEGRTVLLSTHQIAEAEQLADRVGILKDGHLATLERVDRIMTGLPARLRFKPDCMDRALAVLAELTFVRTISSNGSLLISCPQEERLPLLSRLSRAGIELQSFQTEEPSLEEILLHSLSGGDE